MDAEIWRPVIGWEGKYEVSNFGQVRSLRRRGANGRILKPRPLYGRTGAVQAMRVALGTVSNMRGIHVLVLEAFVGPRPSGRQGAHWDGNPANNRLSNLRWATHMENMDDRDRHGRTMRGETHYKAILTEDDVHVIRSATLSNKFIATVYGLSARYVAAIRRRRSWRHI